MKKACFLLIFLIILSLIPSTKASPDGWVSPTGFEDPDSKWANEPNAYDENTASASTGTHNFENWGWFIVLTLDSSITSDKIRFYVDEVVIPPYGINQKLLVDVDVYKDDAWVDVFEGDVVDQTWMEKTFVEGSVSEARLRFKNYGTLLDYLLCEFDFWEVEEAPPETEFTFYETMNISTSSSFWKAKMFTGTETVTISSASYVWKEKLFSFSEKPSIIDSLSILKEKLMAFVEFMETINPTSEVIFIFPSAKIPILFIGACLVLGLIGFVFILSRRKKK